MAEESVSGMEESGERLGGLRVVLRDPYGRKRGTSRYLKAKKYKQGLYRGPRRLAELMVGEEWRTREELAELMGTTPGCISAWFSLIKKYGAAEYVMLSRLRGGGCTSSRELVHPPLPGRRMTDSTLVYRVERSNCDATE